MIKVYLIRHSITHGNTLGRYIGRRTDEPLCREGIRLLEGREYPQAELVFASPMKRCRQTAALIYPSQEVQIEDDLAECDFGIFENKNYKELEAEERYQQWIDSNGTLPFPEGESREAFSQRSVEGFCRCVKSCIARQIHAAAVVAHGGTVMSVLERLAVPHEEYYFWQVKNACGYEVEIDETLWTQGKEEVKVMRKIW